MTIPEVAESELVRLLASEFEIVPVKTSIGNPRLIRFSGPSFANPDTIVSLAIPKHGNDRFSPHTLYSLLDKFGIPLSTFLNAYEGLRGKRRKVFLSYARNDREIALKIAVRLLAAGFAVWDPEREILPGANWAAELNAALESAAAIVALISPEAVASGAISHDIEYALGAKHLRGRLIPVFVRPTEDAPWILKSLPFVRYEGPGKTTDQIIELLGKSSDALQTDRRAS